MLYVLLLVTSIMAVTSDLKLELVQVLFRHGARTCNTFEATNWIPQYIDQSFQDTYGYDQLTNVGKAQAHKLGLVLRERYDDFLGSLYRPHDVYAYSSDYDRTKMTLQLVLAGLYPPAPEQIWNKELMWQPIPMHYAPVKKDTLLRAFSMPKYEELYTKVVNLPAYHEVKKNLRELYQFFEDDIADVLKKNDFMGYFMIFNILSIHKISNAKLPDWYSDDLLNTLRENSTPLLDIMSLTTEMRKCQIGPLIKRFVENMNKSSEMTNPRKMYLYSGHDLNIAAFTRAHNIKEFKYPDFGSAVILEKLRDSKNQLFVRVLAWTGKDYITLKLGKFEEFCPIDEYLKIVENIIPSEEEIDSMIDNRSSSSIFYL